MKSLKDIRTIAIVGAGAMGSSIAQVAAMVGYDTLVYDINSDQLEKAKKNIERNLDIGIEKKKLTVALKNDAVNRLKFTYDLSEVKADIIIEAIVEKLEVKQELFKQLAFKNSANTILATNTSSIPITRIATGIQNPERVVGMHFFMPAHIMKLVEVVSGAMTDQSISEIIKLLAEKMGKIPVMVKDSPGFIVNRVARHYYVESLKILEENVSSAQDIDVLVESAGFKMGPFRLMDFVGNDVNFSVTSSLFESFHYDPKFRPSRIQEQKVESGQLGRKSGKGFYDYSQTS